MAHFAKPVGAPSWTKYIVDDLAAPGSLSGVAIVIGRTCEVVLCAATGLWVRSSQPNIVPNDFKERLSGANRILTLSTRGFGNTTIEVGQGSTVWVRLNVEVKSDFDPPVTVYNPGISHNHQPARRWADIQANPNSSMSLNTLCPRVSPQGLVDWAIGVEFGGKPIALKHLRHYLTLGHGMDFNEDGNIEALLRQDTKVQALILSQLPAAAPASSSFKAYFELRQEDYSDQDFRYAFGGIDRVDFEVNYDVGTVHVWFQDRYEWHPYYPGIYPVLSGDLLRETNCLHAALVELKTTGAADFWMKGEATVPLTVLRGSATTGKKSSTL
jgi:hypothetical protein